MEEGTHQRKRWPSRPTFLSVKVDTGPCSLTGDFRHTKILYSMSTKCFCVRAAPHDGGQTQNQTLVIAHFLPLSLNLSQGFVTLRLGALSSPDNNSTPGSSDQTHTSCNWHWLTDS